MKGETSGNGEITRIILWDTEFSACDGNGAWETGIEINVRVSSILILAIASDSLPKIEIAGAE